MNLDRIEQQAGHLPAYQIADSVNEALMESANLVITAPPGAGKSTLMNVLSGIYPYGTYPPPAHHSAGHE